jgi:tetratricopeptide (TPR) repeat protein
LLSREPSPHLPLSSVGTRAALCLVLLGAVLAGSCGRPKSEPPVITSGSEYLDVLAKAQELSQSALVKFDRGGVLSEAETSSLKESARMLEGLMGFKPDNFGSLLLAGKVYVALGEYEKAAVHLRQCGKLINPLKADPDLRAMLADAHDLAALSLERMGVYEEAKVEAEQALALFQNSPDYLARLASIEIQLRQLPDAKFHLGKALLIDPEHGRSRELMKLLEAARESEGG